MWFIWVGCSRFQYISGVNAIKIEILCVLSIYDPYFSFLIHYFLTCLSETNPLFTKLFFTLQVSTDAGVDTLIPLSLQGKDNPILQQLLPALLNPAVLGELAPSKVC